MSKIRIEVETDASGAVKSLKTLGAEGEENLERVKKSSMAVKVALAGLAVAGVAVVVKGVRSLVNASSEWVAASNVQEDAVNSLKAALQSTGDYTPQLLEQYEKMASAFQRVTTTGDEQLLPMMAKLTTVGGVQEAQMQQATQAALDLAAGLNVDLNTAFLMVSKAAAGNTETLGRYGLQVTKTGDVGKDFEQVLMKINDQFGGQAQAQADTFSGKLQQMANRWGDVQETLGDVLKAGLRPFLDTLSSGLTIVEQFVSAHKTEMIQAFSRALSFVADAAVLAVNAGGALVEAYGEVRAAFGRLLDTALRPVIETLADLFSGLEDWVPSLGGAAQALRDLHDGLAQNAIDQDDLALAIGAGTEQIRNQTRALRDQLVGALATASQGQNELRQATQGATDELGEQGQKVDAVAEALKRMRASWEELNRKREEGRQQQEEDTDATNKGTQAKGRFEQAQHGVAHATAAATDRFHQEIQALQSLKFQFDIGGGETVDIDMESEAIKAVLRKLNSLVSTLPPAYAQWAKAFAENVVQGDLKALQDIVASIQAQGVALEHAGGIKVMEAMNQFKNLAFILNQILGQVKGAASRQHGGLVQRGVPYWVGEQGPEPFVPAQSGRVVSHGDAMRALTGGGMNEGQANEMIRLLRSLLAKDTGVYLDGRPIARNTTRHQSRNTRGCVR